jgi:hypothetical protein
MRLLRFRALLPLLSLPALWLAGCGGFNGVVTPTLSSINPATIAAGSAGFTLTASGTNFTSGTRIILDGIPQTTKVVSNSQLTASITAAQILNPGDISVGVLKADTTSSNVLTLKVTGQGPQGPKLTSISPSSVASGSPDFTLTATGTSFVSGSVITLNGAGITTTFDSATQLHATIPASKVAVAGTINVGVLDTSNKLSNELPLTITGTIPSAPPTLTALNPATVITGSPAITLTATGTNFVNGSKITWNGLALTTTFVSATSVQATIPVEDLATPMTANVAVLNPDSTISNVLPFVVAVNPSTSPTLTSISPSKAVVGAPAFTMTLTGLNFAPGAVAKWAGQPLPTTVVSNTQLTAQVPASDLVSVGQFPITVTNTASSASNPVPFYVGINIFFGEVNDLVWDSARKLLYLSEPGSSSKNPNSVVAIDPVTLVQKATFAGGAGSEPNHLAISDDGKYLYVGLDGMGKVQRLLLPGLTADISIPLGSDPSLGNYFALDLQVAPGTPKTIAVSKGIAHSIILAQGGIAIYDDAVQRPTVVTPTTQPQNVLIDTIQWGTDATAIYAANNENASGDFYQLAVNSSGVTLVSDNVNFFPVPNSRIHFDRGNKLLYGDDGLVVNPVLATQVGNFVSSGAMVPDSGIGNAYFIGQPSSQNGTVGYLVQSFNISAFTPVSTLSLYNVQGVPQHMIRWGTDGLAFNTAKITNCVVSPCNTGDGRLYILSGPFVTKTTP